MKITKIECIPVSPPQKPLEAPVHAQSNVVLVKLHTDDGIVGIAEGGVCQQDTVMQTINNIYAPSILGADPFDIELIMRKISRGYGTANNTALATIDFALHDIVGKKVGVPIYKLLGGLANEKIPLGFVMTVGGWMTPEWAAERCKNAVKAGYRDITLKVGRNRPIEEDIKNLEAIREAVGYDFRLGIDTNGGWDYFTALEALKKMERFNLFKAEQPIPRGDIDGLVRLRQKVSMPICAHEAAMDIQGLMEVIKKGAADMLMFKLVWAPGFVVGRKWAAIAQAAGLQVSCGCMNGSAFESAAQAHFLASDPWYSKIAHSNLGFILIHDIFDTISTPVTDDLAVTVPKVENGYMYPPDGPGLGLELNEAVVAKIITKGKKATVVDKKGIR